MKKIEYFDYQKVAREIKIPDNVLKRIENEVKREFPFDKMMYELHVLRAIKKQVLATKDKITYLPQQGHLCALHLPQ